jgi:2-keto-3-deoxy-galactonokinase
MTSPVRPPCALIGLDWGTTSFRAYRLGADGNVIEAKSAPFGILKYRSVASRRCSNGRSARGWRSGPICR